MDPLWAPWRMPYIEQSEPEPGCLFCNRVHQNDDSKNYIVHRGDRCFVILNLYPYNSGHLMVVPYQHVGRVDLLDPAVGSDLFATTQMTVLALTDVMHPDGFNIGINQGKLAGAGVDEHIHMHVVPRWNGDTNFMPVLANVKVIPEMLSATADKVRPALEALSQRS